MVKFTARKHGYQFVNGLLRYLQRILENSISTVYKLKTMSLPTIILQINVLHDRVDWLSGKFFLVCAL